MGSIGSRTNQQYGVRIVCEPTLTLQGKRLTPITNPKHLLKDAPKYDGYKDKMKHNGTTVRCGGSVDVTGGLLKDQNTIVVNTNTDHPNHSTGKGGTRKHTGKHVLAKRVSDGSSSENGKFLSEPEENGRRNERLVSAGNDKEVVKYKADHVGQSAKEQSGELAKLQYPVVTQKTCLWQSYRMYFATDTSA